VTSAQRSQRKRAARLFTERHPNLDVWMARPTPARLLDLHRLRAWPWLTWLLVERRLRPDLELLLAKPGGVDVGQWWTVAHTDKSPPLGRPPAFWVGARTGHARCCNTPPRCCA
jgi:hypothetical protein